MNVRKKFSVLFISLICGSISETSLAETHNYFQNPEPTYPDEPSLQTEPIQTNTFPLYPQPAPTAKVLFDDCNKVKQADPMCDGSTETEPCDINFLSYLHIAKHHHAHHLHISKSGENRAEYHNTLDEFPGTQISYDEALCTRKNDLNFNAGEDSELALPPGCKIILRDKSGYQCHFSCPENASTDCRFIPSPTNRNRVKKRYTAPPFQRDTHY